MEFSLKFTHSARSVFWRSESVEAPFLGEHLTLDSNKVFRKSLIIEVNNDEVEIPVIARAHFERIIEDALTYDKIMKVEKIVLPLYDNAINDKRRTFDSIIGQFFTGVEYGNRLQKITTDKGEVYYGGKGIILDEGYTPLLLCTLTAKNIHIDSNHSNMTYYRPICYINPKVVLETDKLINKGIVRKLIPFYTNNEMIFPNENTSLFSSNPKDRKVKVIIDNFNRFFVEPIKPTLSTCSDDALNKCLIDNIEDITMLI